MPLKIFISSVFRELAAERRTLEEEIRKLEELFVGMEYFGSDPASPAEYCVDRVRDSDLYVGVIGNEYGSIDERRQQSFTEIEYDAALAWGIPCLLYFRRVDPTIAAHPAEDRLVEFKRRLAKQHIVYEFNGSDDLKLQFLIDLIKLLQGPLFYKAIPSQPPQIPVESLRAFCQGLLRERIKVVAQDKYIPEIYIERRAEQDIAWFTRFDERFRDRIPAIFGKLIDIQRAFRLEAISGNRLTSMEGELHELERIDAGIAIVAELERGFFFEQVNDLINEITSVILTREHYRIPERVMTVKSKLRNLPFIAAEDLTEVEKTLGELNRRSIVSKKLPEYPLYYDLLSLFPSCRDQQERLVLANDLLRELTHLVGLQSKRCLAVVDPAGRGKTSTICHQAQVLAEQYPVILLSGQMELASDYDLERQVQHALDAGFHGIFPDWMNRVSPALKAAGKWMFIIIDGINENANPTLLNKLLAEFLPKLETRRIKLIVTCRDIFWEIFEHHLRPYLFGVHPVSLQEFDSSEWEQAASVYFARYRIQVLLSDEARTALQNPLLLRFFCEANRDLNLDRVSTLRLVSVFDHYVRRVTRVIADRLGFLGTDPVVGFLVKIGELMWRTHSAKVGLDELGLEPEQAARADSIYALIRAENIILEETAGRYSGQKYVRFVYDEFMEYGIARAWLERIEVAEDPHYARESLLEDAATAITAFPAALGAILFLDQMLDARGTVVNRAIAQIEAFQEDFLATRQYALLQALEHISVETIDDPVLSVLGRFEQIVREDVKERLAPIVLKLQARWSEHPKIRDIVRRILEVDTKSRETKVNEGPQEPPDPSRSGTLIRTLVPRDETPLLETGESVALLPPGRFHYSEETKLNAIALLVAAKDTEAYKLADAAIEKLGRVDLHSALGAVQALDLASDEALFAMLPRYLSERGAEYRVYCAWLLRNRYGGTPARHLVGLLLDDDSRVREFTMGLFDERQIEEELLTGILGRLRDKGELEQWHLIDLIKLLGKREHVSEPELVNIYGSAVAEALLKRCLHRSSLVRLEAYRSLTTWVEFFDAHQVLALLAAERESYIKRLTSRFEALRHRGSTASDGR